MRSVALSVIAAERKSLERSMWILGHAGGDRVRGTLEASAYKRPGPDEGSYLNEKRD